MRAVTSDRSRDEGAVLILVGLMMMALIGFAALIVDIGALAVENREVQNGTDAAALAVAQDCAAGTSCGPAPARANQYLTLNAEENANSVLDEVCGSGPGLTACSGPAPGGITNAKGWVRVRGGAPVDYVLAPVMGPLTGRAEAASVAAWGLMGAGVATPLIFSVCEFIALGGDPDGGTFPTGSKYIYFHGVGGTNEPGVGSCTGSPSGQDLPGGFGWVGTSADCETPPLAVGQWVPAGTGNSVPNGCVLASWRNEEILITLFDDERGTGATAEYHIAGFVGFKIDGYRFPGATWPKNFQCKEAPGASGSCVHGQFTKVTRSGGDFGKGSDYGASIVKMVG